VVGNRVETGLSDMEMPAMLKYFIKKNRFELIGLGGMILFNGVCRI